ncbi:MAG: glucosaminidase domain-containing protein [Candidatus Nomurabacteria bacterium]|nr:glucosaminidase domain-containing protein [Candidatus Nomurabacteria bacterium]
MKNKKIIQFLQSFVAIPLFATTLPFAGVTAIQSQAVAISQEPTQITSSLLTPEEAKIRAEHIKDVNDFFESRNAPLAGYGEKFVDEAAKNDIDWRLLPAIATRESNAGKDACKSSKAPNNNFGWFSCKRGFSSVDESIEYISKTLGGNNEKAPHYTDDMNTTQILKRYNPDSIVPGYSKQVIRIMKVINSDEDII